jgi:hypothetical protein
MVRQYFLLAVLGIGIGLMAGCSRIDKEPSLEGMVPFDNLPAEYGTLVAITPYSGWERETTWYEFWFSDPVSGKITHVPMHRRSWSYRPEMVRTIERLPAGLPISRQGGES